MTQWEIEVPNTHGPQPGTLPVVGWGHQVSTDLLRFHRIAPALVPGPPSTTMEGCYDGSVSFVHKGGDASQPLTPMLMADGACGELPDPEPGPNKHPPGRGCAESFGNGSSGGTLAFPADLNDPNLTVWEKEGPIRWEDCGVGGGPSSIWQPRRGVWNVMLRANGSATEARYETRDPSFKTWTLADDRFIKERIGCGGLWHTLPRSVAGTEREPRPFTHCQWRPERQRLYQLCPGQLRRGRPELWQLHEPATDGHRAGGHVRQLCRRPRRQQDAAHELAGRQRKRRRPGPTFQACP